MEFSKARRLITAYQHSFKFAGQIPEIPSEEELLELESLINPDDPVETADRWMSWKRNKNPLWNDMFIYEHHVPIFGKNIINIYLKRDNNEQDR